LKLKLEMLRSALGQFNASRLVLTIPATFFGSLEISATSPSFIIDGQLGGTLNRQGLWP
jgi:hypothetical protein